MIDLFDMLFNSTSTCKRTKRKYTKRTYKEKDCEVSYHPEWLFKMNLPYAEIVEI